jgi:cytochrome P450
MNSQSYLRLASAAANLFAFSFVTPYRAMCDACDDPKVFRPERHLDPSTAPVDPRKIIFGFGRRKCPGMPYIDTGLWLAVTTILHTFDILPGPSGPPKEAKFKPHVIL